MQAPERPREETVLGGGRETEGHTQERAPGLQVPAQEAETHQASAWPHQVSCAPRAPPPTQQPPSHTPAPAPAPALADPLEASSPRHDVQVRYVTQITNNLEKVIRLKNRAFSKYYLS